MHFQLYISNHLKQIWINNRLLVIGQIISHFVVKQMDGGGEGSWLVFGSQRAVGFSPGGRELLPQKFGRDVRPASQNPYPIFDQKLRFFLRFL